MGTESLHGQVAPVDGPEANQLKKVKDSIAKEKDYFLLVEKIKERRMKREQQAQLESVQLPPQGSAPRVLAAPWTFSYVNRCLPAALSG